MNLAGIQEVVRLAEQRWAGFEFRITGNEAHGPCPVCGQADEDGFVLFEDGGFYCRPGGHVGWLDDDKPRRLTETEINSIKIRQLERLARDQARRLTALERMHRCVDHLTYHKLMDADDRDYWHSQGMTDETIDRYLLGVCWNCPTDKEHRPSRTIPIINGGKLVNIRHRIIEADGGDKYRPHLAGLGNTLFNADNLYKGFSAITVVEGEKKSIVLSQHGFETVGIMGKAAFPPAWAVRFEEFERVNICLDPDAQDKAHKLAALFGDVGRVVVLPVKADDFFVKGGTVEQFKAFMRWARRAD